MMRFGCGAHVAHGHGHSSHGRSKGAGVAGDIDPVCGMKVASDSGYSKVQAGVRMAFCSKKCLDEFEADPGRYLKQDSIKGVSS